MSNIVILCGRIESAVGGIAVLTAQQLKSHGHNVCLVGLKNNLSTEVPSSVDCSVESRVYKKVFYEERILSSTGLKKLFYRGRLKCLLFFHKEKLLGVKNNRRRMIVKLDRIIERHEVNSILAFYMPIDILDIAYTVSNKHGIPCGYYLLDNAHKEYTEKFDVFFCKASRVFCAPWILKDDWFRTRYLTKFTELSPPIPQLFFPIASSEEESHASIQCIMYGALYSDIRNPKKLLESFLKTSDNFVLRTFCSGCSDVLNEYKPRGHGRIVVCDRLKKSELIEEIIKSNIVFIIGNTVTNQVPSKVFEAIGIGKPIVYFWQNQEDMAINILKRYPISLIVDYKDIDENVLMKWCGEVKNSICSYEEIRKCLPEYTTEYYVRQITKFLK